ncbi:MAG: oligosaccharide flippase family protein, partial [Sphingosinicella sp.]
MATDAHRLVMRGGWSAAGGYAIRFGARLLFMFVAARLFGVTLFGAYVLAIAAIELAVAVGGLGMKRYLFRLLEERTPERSPLHVVIDAAILVTVASLLLAAAMIAVVMMLPPSLIAANTALAILVVAPMIAGQALLDLLLAATRWKHRIRYEVTARSLIEPYVAILAAAGAAAAGWTQSGLLVSYWAGTLAALLYAIAGLRACYGAAPERFRFSAGRLGGVLRSSAMPTLTDLAGGLFARLDLYLVGMLMGEAPAGIYG